MKNYNYISEEIKEKNNLKNVVGEYREQNNSKNNKIAFYKRISGILALVVAYSMASEGLKMNSGRNSIVNNFDSVLEENGYTIFPHSDGPVILHDGVFMQPDDDEMLDSSLTTLVNTCKACGLTDVEIDLGLRSYEIIDSTLDSSISKRYNASMNEYYHNKTKKLTK